MVFWAHAVAARPFRIARIAIRQERSIPRVPAQGFYPDSADTFTKIHAGSAELPIVAVGATFSLGHNVSSRLEVDEVMAQAERAGATIAKPAQDAFWGGYAGCFQDPRQHLWEIAWNPEWVIPQ
jgi:hypothetical protein